MGYTIQAEGRCLNTFMLSLSFRIAEILVIRVPVLAVGMITLQVVFAIRMIPLYVVLVVRRITLYAVGVQDY